MSLCNEEELERYNKDKIRKMQDTCEKLRAKAEQCEIKNQSLTMVIVYVLAKLIATVEKSSHFEKNYDI